MKRWLLMVSMVLFMGGARIALAQGDPVRIPADQLPAAIAAAQPGDTIEVTGGEFRGNLVVDKTLTLIGIDRPVLDAGNTGTVLRIDAPDTVVRGFTLRNSGNSLDREDSGIVATAPRVLVEDNILQNVLFGIYANSAADMIIRGNDITGQDLDIARRGDLIRVWDSNGVLIENNKTHNGRDVVLWYSERLTLRGNEFTNGRYGLHFMYCDDAQILGNRLTNNSVGAYLMYGRRMKLDDNLIAFNRGPSGYGIGLKDMDDSVITGNRILDNRVGLFNDGSPREMDSIGIIEGNLFAYNDFAMEMLPSVRHNRLQDNSFIENEQQVVIAGGGRLGENDWSPDGRGNYWSDYAGYDADGDGLGDIEFRSEHLLDDLLSRRPELRLFLYSPVVNAVEFAARAFPLVRPQPILVDTAPLTQPVIPTAAPQPITSEEGALWPVFILPFGLLILLVVTRMSRRHYRLPQPATSTTPAAHIEQGASS